MDYHFPVLAKECLDLLDPKPNQVFIDGTLGNGGHTLQILKTGATVYGIDQDPKNIEIALSRIKDEKLDKNFFPINSNFNKLEKIIENKIKQKVDGLILDLGLSINQQKSQNRGFSFKDETSLDMRLDPKTQENTAENIINTYSFDELYEIFTKYAQEKLSKPLILKIIRERQRSPIKTATRLTEIIKKYYQEHNLKSKIDPSTKIFMALRIAVNDEFANLKSVLKQSLKIVKSNGVVCIISFHSGEDRIIKQFINENISKKLIVSNSKAIKPSFSEIKTNPLSRSAILRSYKIK